MELSKLEWEGLSINISIMILSDRGVHFDCATSVVLGQRSVVGIVFTYDFGFGVGIKVLRSVNRTLLLSGTAESINLVPVSTKSVVVEGTAGGLGNSEQAGKSKGLHFI